MQRYFLYPLCLTEKRQQPIVYCNAVYDKLAFTDSLKQSYKKIKKLPSWWMYSALTLMVAFVAFGFYTVKVEQRQSARLVLQPAAGHL